MGVGPAAGAQIQDDVKRTGALHRDQETPGSTVHRDRNPDLGRDRPIRTFQAAVVICCVSQFLFVSKIVLGRQRSVMFVGLQFHARRLFGVPLGVSS
jgi:hypothetical protein